MLVESGPSHSCRTNLGQIRIWATLGQLRGSPDLPKVPFWDVGRASVPQLSGHRIISAASEHVKGCLAGPNFRTVIWPNLGRLWPTPPTFDQFWTKLGRTAPCGAEHQTRRAARVVLAMECVPHCGGRTQAKTRRSHMALRCRAIRVRACENVFAVVVRFHPALAPSGRVGRHPSGTMRPKSGRARTTSLKFGQQNGQILSNFGRCRR